MCASSGGDNGRRLGGARRVAVAAAVATVVAPGFAGLSPARSARGPSAHGPDLTVEDIASVVIGDWQTLAITGTVRVTVRNIGDLGFDGDVLVSVFEDLDRDGDPDPDFDSVLAVVTQPPMAALTEAQLTVPISATTSFRDSPISVYADSTNAIAEFSELNNMTRTGLFCRSPSGVAAPDLTVSRILAEFLPDRSWVDLSARIGNAGAFPSVSGTTVTFSAGSPIGQAVVSRSLAPGEFETVHLPWQYPPGFEGVVSATLDFPDMATRDCNRLNDTHSAWVDLVTADQVGPIFLPRLQVPFRYDPTMCIDLRQPGAGAALGPPSLVVGVAVVFGREAVLARRVDEVSAKAELPHPPFVTRVRVHGVD